MYFYIWLTLAIVVGFLLYAFIKLFSYHKQYEQSLYKTISNNKKWKIYFDKGLYGEFLIVKELEGIDASEKVFVNVYLAHAKNEKKTTEVDVIYINSSGIFVIESKNYSGWIFGNENDKNWTQTLNRNTKIKFFNPIRQNAGHISALKKALGEPKDIPFYNCIIFSQRCVLKKITVTSKQIFVLNRPSLRKTIKEISAQNILTKEQIQHFSDKLSPFTNVDEATKHEHIRHIEEIITPPLDEKQEQVRQDDEIITPPLDEKQQQVRRDEEIITPPLDEKQEQVRQDDEIITQPLEVLKPHAKDANDIVCKKCGSIMVLRTAKRGENTGKTFWGCANFPKCREIVT